MARDITAAELIGQLMREAEECSGRLHSMT